MEHIQTELFVYNVSLKSYLYQFRKSNESEYLIPILSLIGLSYTSPQKNTYQTYKVYIIPLMFPDSADPLIPLASCPGTYTD